MFKEEESLSQVGFAFSQCAAPSLFHIRARRTRTSAFEQLMPVSTSSNATTEKIKQRKKLLMPAMDRASCRANVKRCPVAVLYAEDTWPRGGALWQRIKTPQLNTG